MEENLAGQGQAKRKYKLKQEERGLFDYVDKERQMREQPIMLDRLSKLIPFEEFRSPLGPVEFSAFLWASDRLTRCRIATPSLRVFKERVGEKEVEQLFERMRQLLAEAGLVGQHGRIMDATIVEAPRPHVSAPEQEQLKAGEMPSSRADHPAASRQTDLDARWTKKNGRSYHGYKNHVKVDLQTKLIEKFAVRVPPVCMICNWPRPWWNPPMCGNLPTVPIVGSRLHKCWSRRKSSR